MIFIGIEDDGNILGLSPDEVRKTNKLISDGAGTNVRPSIIPMTENVVVSSGKTVIVVRIPEGSRKPSI